MYIHVVDYQSLKHDCIIHKIAFIVLRPTLKRQKKLIKNQKSTKQLKKELYNKNEGATTLNIKNYKIIIIIIILHASSLYAAKAAQNVCIK